MMQSLHVTTHEIVHLPAPMRVEMKDERIAYQGEWFIRRTTIHPDSEPVWFRVVDGGLTTALEWVERDFMERTYWMEAA